MFQEVDPVLGPEMRSTGEVLGLSASYGEAFYKAQEATQSKLPLEGNVLLSVTDQDKADAIAVAKILSENGFQIYATNGTYKALEAVGIPAKKVKKYQEGRPNSVDLITNGKIDLIINSPNGKTSVHASSYIRKAAIKAKVPYVTTIAAANAAAKGIRYMKTHKNGEIKSLQQLHSEICNK